MKNIAKKFCNKIDSLRVQLSSKNVQERICIEKIYYIPKRGNLELIAFRKSHLKPFYGQTIQNELFYNMFQNESHLN